MCACVNRHWHGACALFHFSNECMCMLLFFLLVFFIISCTMILVYSFRQFWNVHVFFNALEMRKPYPFVWAVLHTYTSSYWKYFTLPFFAYLFSNCMMRPFQSSNVQHEAEITNCMIFVPVVVFAWGRVEALEDVHTHSTRSQCIFNRLKH